MKIILSGGGTGGHIYPALALKDYILSQYPEAEFLYIGTEKGLEHKIVCQQNIPFKTIKIQGLKRSLSLENFRTLWYMVSSIGKAKKIIRDFQPDIVIGTGGYVCAPVLYAASKCGVPTLIHEQNSVAGITNKFLAKYVDNIATCFEEVAADFEKYRHKIVLTGNPRGQEIVEKTFQANCLDAFGLSPNKPTVLLFGGSRGAMNLNKDFVQSYQDYTEQNYQVLAVTGEAHYDTIQKQLGNQYDNITVVPYLHNMVDVLHAVDLVVCRSGATTLAELTALGKASILIPSPYVTNNHQEKNAMALVGKQAALMVKETELGTGKLFALTTDLMLDSEKRQKMASEAQKMGVRDASSRLMKIIKEYTEA